MSFGLIISLFLIVFFFLITFINSPLTVITYLTPVNFDSMDEALFNIFPLGYPTLPRAVLVLSIYIIVCLVLKKKQKDYRKFLKYILLLHVICSASFILALPGR